MSLKGYTPKPASFDDVIFAFQNFLEFNDFDAIRVMLATIVANGMDTDPVWLFLVAPSSSAKSELVRSIELIEGTYMLSSLTPNTLISGALPKKDKETGKEYPDPSLLLRVPDGTIFLMKDFTTILNMRIENRLEILAQLREVYDGKISKEFGTGFSKEWSGKVGFISGVTYEIEEAILVNSKFGDRFLYYKMSTVDENKAFAKIDSVMGNEENLRYFIKEAVAGYFLSLKEQMRVKPLPKYVTNAIAQLCRLAVRMRGFVKRDAYGNHDIERVSPMESPMRVYKEVVALAMGLAALRGGEWSDDDYHIVAKICLDATPSWRTEVVKSLEATRDMWMATDDIGLSLKRPTKAIRLILEDLECFGVVLRTKGEEGFAHTWKLSPEACAMIAYLQEPSPQQVLIKTETQSYAESIPY